MAKTYGPMRLAVAAVIILACRLAWCPCALALNPALDVSQYRHTAWKIREGFSEGSIISTAQTPDGYLWVGTSFGLSRFDGVQNVPWRPPPDQHLPSNTITRLIVAHDGTLWIGTWTGLASWKNGKLTQYAELAGLAIFALVEDREGSIWAGANGPPPDGKLCEIRNGGVRCHPEMDGVAHGVFGLHEDHEGNLWVGVEAGVWRWKPGQPVFYPLPGLPNGRMQSMVDSDDGALLIATTDAIMRLADGKVNAVYRLPAARRGFRVLSMLRDRDGGLWVGPAGRGLVHIHQGRTDGFSQSDGLSGDDIYGLFEDRERNIWVDTINGLDRFSEPSVVTYSRKQGLSDIPWGGVLAATDGSVWFATLDGLNRLNQHNVTTYHQHRAAGGTLEIVGSGLPDEGVGSLFQDSRGGIWVSTLNEIGYLKNDRFIPAAPPGGLISSLTEDSSGNMWIANRDLGLFRLSPLNEFQRIPWSTFGRTDAAVVLTPDPSHDGLWLGFTKGGIAWFRDGHVRSSYSAADGLSEGRVNQLRFDGKGALWIATEGGLSRLDNGRLATLSSKSGLPCDAVQWTMEDAQSVWLMTPCGLVQVARSELDEWAIAGEKSNRTIHPTVFDSSDGLRTLAVVGDYTPRVSRSPDGKLWFIAPDGISVVDPRHLPFNNLPPPVHIEKITADRKAYEPTSPAGGPLRLPALIRDFQIDYTALSLVAPDKVRFRYKLEGRDADWKDAVTRRQAFYSDLPPRSYRFRVVASNNSGVWNEQGTALDFSIAPAYWQTTWFRTACAAIVLLLLWALYQLRMRQIARVFNVRVEARVAERNRIARDLHDTLLQSFQGLLLRFQTAYALFDTRPTDAKDVLGSSIDQTAQAITEGREAVQGLRASTVESNDLAQAITTLGEQLVAEESSATSVGMYVEVEGTPRNLHPIVRDEIYRIASEALRNAFRHAEAQQIEVEFRYDQRQFRLRVRDDGKGIEPTLLTAEGRAGHFGLHGMRERAKLMGGKLTVWTAAESGTEIELILPAARAYAASSRRSWFAEKFSWKSVRSKS
jgi:signal transduction histidine kinase/ligand-binding sensor domain-containing protein